MLRPCIIRCVPPILLFTGCSDGVTPHAMAHQQLMVLEKTLPSPTHHDGEVLNRVFVLLECPILDWIFSQAAG